MLIHYWCPYLTNIATISSVRRSAIYLKKFDKNNELKVEIINSCGEWIDFKKNEHNINVRNLLSFNIFKILPKIKFLSKISLAVIFILSFIPLLIKIRKEKPNYLIVHLLTSLPIMLSIFFHKKTKIILRISGLPKLNYFRRTLWKLFSDKIYLVTTPTNLTRDDLINQKIFSSDKIKVLRDPIVESKKINSLKKLPIQNPFFKNNEYYLAIGRLTDQKNLIFLVNGFAKVINKLSTKKLCIIGSGEQKSQLIEIIKKNKLEKNIILLDYQKNPYNYINNCKAIISTSFYEDPGFVLIEAAYLNKLLISSNSRNGPKEMSLQKNIGFFFNPKDIMDFNNKLLESEKYDNSNKIINSKKYVKKFSTFQHYKNLINLLN
jgi:glycosyltransferase involved in cell wall biosynthesis